MNGTTPGLDTTTSTGYDQLVAGGTGGTINLANATLNISLGTSFPSGGGNTFTILHNTSGSAIVGTFSGLAEGATLTVSNQSFSITYKGGSDGQDVVLTSLISTTTTVSPVTVTLVSGQPVDADGHGRARRRAPARPPAPSPSPAVRAPAPSRWAPRRSARARRP